MSALKHTILFLHLCSYMCRRAHTGFVTFLKREEEIKGGSVFNPPVPSVPHCLFGFQGGVQLYFPFQISSGSFSVSKFACVLELYPPY